MTAHSRSANRLMFASVALIGYWAMLCIATHIPGHHAPHVHVSDKILHFLGYAGLTFLLACVLSATRWRGPMSYYAIFATASAYGAVDEWMQSYVPNRRPDFADWIADVAGAVAGLVAFAMLRMIANRANSSVSA